MFDRALALNPSSAEILTSYASWASTFGKPEAGVAGGPAGLAPEPEHAADGPRQISLRLLHDRQLRPGAAAPRAHPARGLWPRRYIYRAVLLNETGNTEDAQAAVAEALERFPSISVEGWSGQAGFSDPERQRWVVTMRETGLSVMRQ